MLAKCVERDEDDFRRLALLGLRLGDALGSVGGEDMAHPCRIRTVDHRADELHVARVARFLEQLATRRLDPTPVVTHRLPLEDAAEAYRLFDSREATKVVLSP